MISFIVCSIKIDVAKILHQNILESIGNIQFEWICVDNRNTDKGICQVYNEAAEQAQGEILCFVHEDIEFKKQDWGKNILRIFAEKRNAGIVGVAGSTLISKTPAGWYNFYLENENRFYLCQHEFDNSHKMTFLNINPNYEKLSRVIAVDGVIMFVRKSVWQESRFDEENFKEFHFYDIDFSARIASKYENFISYDILIEHHSFGNINKSWTKNAVIFDKKLKKQLPLSISKIDSSEMNKEEEKKLIHLLSNMIKYKISTGTYLRYVYRILKINPILGIKYVIKAFL